jgi:hypothetical protein
MSTMATENTTTPPELEIDERDDGTVIVTDPSIAEPPADDADGDAPPRTGADDDDGPTEQEELAQATDEAAREAVRARRRQERKDRKQKQQDVQNTLRAELRAREQENRQLHERLSVIERRANGSELAQLDGAIGEAEAAVGSYKMIIDEATKRSDGAAVADAMEKMVLARERARDLTQVRRQMTTQGQQPSGTQRPVVDPQLLSHAQAFLADHPWYNVRGGDSDSDITAVLDRNLAKEGMSPTTKEYWVELDKRVKQYLPHRAGQKGGIVPGETAQKPSRSVVTGSSRESAVSSGRSFELSADRVKALKDAGMWDDPKTRADMIRSYRDHDRNAAAAAAAKK